MPQNFEYFFFEKVSSTNIEIKKIFETNSPKDSLALLSNIQLNGKGRSENKWISKPGDFTASYLLNEAFAVPILGQLNIISSVTILKAIKSMYKNIVFKLKWPNDIFVNNKKIGGILLESKIHRDTVEFVIIGLGLNIISSPTETKYETAKIVDYSNKINNKYLFKLIGDLLIKYIDHFKINGFSFFQKEWIKNSKDIGKFVSIKLHKKSYYGKFLKIDAQGNLILQTNSGTKKFSCGELG